ncbi:hypothetical protein LTR36_009632 [Oleoguttula mirabilis]|uniref:C3H1-type domain-containing protein n=1 Tax=Oleoguttula mirabilis TaxID=1507867 RepID=A0AAV9J5H4_9PEZI|nr:hypothetical protein LTR36_009632 [Oleoguttula mirabilis]
MQNNIFSEQPSAKKTICHDWPLGTCPYGVGCVREHPPSLNPGLFMLREHKEYEVPNDVGVACGSCLQALRECDKEGRISDNDPCSECRWYGGPGCKCTLSADSSYNDQVFAQMKSRGPKYDYALAPEPKDRSAPRGKLLKSPEPMPANEIRPDWKGQSKEELLKKGDFLPDFVRARPMAYVVPPRLSHMHKKASQNKKRKLEDDAPPVTPTQASSLPDIPAGPPSVNPVYSLPSFPAGPPSVTPASAMPVFPNGRPPRPDARYGEPATTVFDWQADKWEHRYLNGVVVSGPPIGGLAQSHSTRPDPDTNRISTLARPQPAPRHPLPTRVAPAPPFASGAQSGNQRRKMSVCRPSARTLASRTPQQLAPTPTPMAQGTDGDRQPGVHTDTQMIAGSDDEDIVY